MGKHAEGMRGGVSVQELLKNNHVNAGSRKARRQAENRAEKKSRFNFRTRLATAVGLTAVMALAGVQNTEKAHAAPTPAAASIDIVPVYAEASVPKAASAQEVQLMSAPVATAIPMAEQAPAATSGPDWDRLATCESGDINIPGSGQWHRNDGMFDGGLQFLDSTWDGFGGNAYAPTADQATREQQIEIAEKVLAEQGPGAWPTCSDKLPGWWEGGGEPTPAPAPAPEAPTPAPMPIPEVAPIVPFCDRVAPGSTFTSGYGERWGTLHDGADCAAPEGTPIYALEGGTVIDSGPAQGFGWWVRIQEDDGGIGTYGHMYDDNVEVGQHVNTGDLISWVGNNGQSTGAHVHVRAEGEGDPLAVYGDGPAPGFNQAPAPVPAPAPAPEVMPVPEDVPTWNNPAPAPAPEDLTTSFEDQVQTVDPNFQAPKELEELEDQVAPDPGTSAPPNPDLDTDVWTPPVVEAPAPTPTPDSLPEWVPPQHAEDFTRMQNDLDTAIQNFNNLFPQTQPR